MPLPLSQILGTSPVPQPSSQARPPLSQILGTNKPANDTRPPLGQILDAPNNPPTQPEKNFFGASTSDSTYGKIIDNSITRGIQNIFPGKKVGEAIGTLGGYGATAAEEKLGVVPKGTTAAYDTSAPSPLQVAGDVAQGALTVAAPSVGNGATIGGRIAANTALGVGLGASNAIAEGKSAGDVAKSGALGGAIGGGASAAGEGISALVKKLPNWLTKKALPKLKEGNADYALENTKVGSIKSLLNTSDESVKNYESQVQAVLSHPENAVTETSPAMSAIQNHLDSAQQILENTPTEDLKAMGGTKELLNRTKINIVDGIKAQGFVDEANAVDGINLSKVKSLDDLKKAINVRTSPIGSVFTELPNAQLDDNKVLNVLKQVAPKNKDLVDKVANGTASLVEQNALRKELDQATKKVFTDNPSITFNKQIGHIVANSLRDSVQTTAPETAPIFANYAKELDLNKALTVAQKKISNKSTVGLYDILSAIGGGTVGGIPGAAAGVAAEKVLRSPAADLLAAKGIKAVGKVAPAVGTLFNATKAPIIKKSTQ